MIWTMLSFGIIFLWVLGMILAAKLTDKSSRLARWAGLRGNCCRGAVSPSWKMITLPGATLIPKGPR